MFLDKLTEQQIMLIEEHASAYWKKTHLEPDQVVLVQVQEFTGDSVKLTSWFEPKSREEQKTGWIAVEDRIPDSVANVLVYCSDRGVDVGYYDYHTHQWKRFIGLDTFLMMEIEPCAVTHWMPFPESPKVSHE